MSSAQEAVMTSHCLYGLVIGALSLSRGSVFLTFKLISYRTHSIMLDESEVMFQGEIRCRIYAAQFAL
jgi:hypothetical protein